VVYLESVLVETVYRYASLRCVCLLLMIFVSLSVQSESILKLIFFSVSTCCVFGFVFRCSVSFDETCLILGC